MIRWIIGSVYYDRSVSGLGRKRKQHTSSLILSACGTHRSSTQHRSPKSWKRSRRRDYNE